MIAAKSLYFVFLALLGSHALIFLFQIHDVQNASAAPPPQAVVPRRNTLRQQREQQQRRRQQHRKVRQPPRLPIPDHVVYQACPDKNETLAILHSANGGTFLHGDEVTCHSLPSWKNVTSLYGKGPYIIGTETCQAYRDMLAKRNAKPNLQIAGTYNTGTNYMSHMMRLNINRTLGEPQINKKDALEYSELPWGKHGPLKHRGQSLMDPELEYVNTDTILPVVMVRDPYRWLASMCKESYFVTWNRTRQHCPLVAPPSLATTTDMPEGAFTGVYHCANEKQNLGDVFPSLPHFWSDFYRQYWEDSKPRLFVRHEDLVFHAEEVIRQVAACAGMALRSNDLEYFVQASKRHGQATNLMAVLQKYGHEEGRYDGMTQADLKFAEHYFDSEILQAFHYGHAPEGYVAPEHPDPIPQPDHAFVLKNQRKCQNYTVMYPNWSPESD